MGFINVEDLCVVSFIKKVSPSISLLSIEASALLFLLLQFLLTYLVGHLVPTALLQYIRFFFFRQRNTIKYSSKMATANKKLIVAVIGYTGGVGSCLLTAMKKIDLLPHALVRSSTMTIGRDASEEIPIDYAKLSAYLLQQDGIPVIADVTASAAVQENYEGWLKQGISVVAANKGIFAGSETKYRSLLEAANQGGCRLLHETTVGAGTSVATTTQKNR
jgi:hypothetical protein